MHYTPVNKKKVDYHLLQQLPFRVLRKPTDGFHNMVNNVVNRSLSWRTEVVQKMSSLIDLGEVVMLSRVHFIKCRIMNIKIEISEKENGPFIEIFKDIIVVSGNIKVVKIGNLPCRFFRITVLKGSPIMDYTKLECYGMSVEHITTKYDTEDVDMLLYNPYSFIYMKDQELKYLSINSSQKSK